MLEWVKTRADDEAITIFGRNLEQLLLSSPAGEKRVIGLDPGFRTGVKVAVVSATGSSLRASMCACALSSSAASCTIWAPMDFMCAS